MQVLAENAFNFFITMPAYRMWCDLSVKLLELSSWTRELTHIRLPWYAHLVPQITQLKQSQAERAACSSSAAAMLMTHALHRLKLGITFGCQQPASVVTGRSNPPKPVSIPCSSPPPWWGGSVTVFTAIQQLDPGN